MQFGYPIQEWIQISSSNLMLRVENTPLLNQLDNLNSGILYVCITGTGDKLLDSRHISHTYVGVNCQDRFFSINFDGEVERGDTDITIPPLPGILYIDPFCKKDEKDDEKDDDKDDEKDDEKDDDSESDSDDDCKCKDCNCKDCKCNCKCNCKCKRCKCQRCKRCKCKKCKCCKRCKCKCNKKGEIVISMMIIILLFFIIFYNFFRNK